MSSNQELLDAAAHTDIGRVRSAINKGADVNCKHPQGDNKTSLHFASQFGHLEIVRLLLQHGADANAPDGVGLTPLWYACQYGHLDVIRLLLQHGADVNAPDRHVIELVTDDVDTDEGISERVES
eukprot:m.24847 g.24847  ORF g.24847 m.24847 type:complete len:125 (-) comp9754_c1_seq2:61-435(-)